MTEMETFRRNASMLGLCDTYAQKWDSCNSKKQLFSLATDVNSLAYLGETIAKGIGLTPKFISEEFHQFINGRFINSADGYTSALYCQYKGDEITVNTTVMLIIDYKGVINIPKNRPCELYLCNCEVEIIGEGNGIVYLFNSELSNASLSPVIIKENNKY